MAVLIGLMGAECSGKTTLAQALTHHFRGLWLPGFLHTFYELHGRPPLASEQSMMLQAQWIQQTEALQQARARGCSFVFCDTTAPQTAICSEFHSVFRCEPGASRLAA